MGSIKEKANGIKEKFNNLSKNQKIIIAIVTITLLAVGIYMIILLNTTQYSVLFSGMDPKDSGAVIEKLKEKGVEYKIQNEDILVPQELVDSLRMEMATEVNITGGSSGWELFSQDKMVSTEFEDNIKYVNALSGEIERTIKSFEEVKDCKVNLVVPEKSVFIREKQPSSAAVVIMLQDGVKELRDSQVKTIVALLTGSVENLPVENVHIAVNGMELVTGDLFKDNNDVISSDEQEKMRKEREKAYEEKILDVLNGPFGNGVKVAVNLDMNFDAKQSEKITYEEGVILSEQKSTNNSNSGDDVSSSPVDDNMGSLIDTTGSGNSTNSSESITNYKVPENKEIVIESPGKIEKMTISVVIDENLGKIDEEAQYNIRNLAANAVGFNPERGDSISVASMNFIDSNNGLLDKTYEDMLLQSEKDRQEKLIRTFTYAIGGIILLFILLFIIRNVGRKDDEFEELQEVQESIANTIEAKAIEFAPIDFDVQNEQAHFANEVKKYAKDKPEQVVDIIKSWLAEDER